MMFKLWKSIFMLIYVDFYVDFMLINFLELIFFVDKLLNKSDVHVHFTHDFSALLCLKAAICNV